MPRILCLGMSALDAIYRVPAIPTTPTKVLATGFTECGGGMAANASVAVARLGGDAHYWGRLGADPLGDRILAELAQEGVDVGAVRRLAGRVSPSAAILVDDRGERLVCAYNDPELDTDPAWLPLEQVARLRGGAGRRALAGRRPGRVRRGRDAWRDQRVRRRCRAARGAHRPCAARRPRRVFAARTRARDRRVVAGSGPGRPRGIRPRDRRRHAGGRWLSLARGRRGTSEQTESGNHLHSTQGTMTGLIDLGYETGEKQYSEIGRKLYENGLKPWRTSYGWAKEYKTYEDKSNWHFDSGEANNTGDYIESALLLGKFYDHSYFDDAECFVRNGLLAAQLLDTGWIAQSGEADTMNTVYSDMRHRAHGAFVFTTPNGYKHYHTDLMGGALQSLAETYNSIVTKDRNGVHVNMLFPCELNGLKIESFIPEQGKVKITLLENNDLTIKLPGWMDKGSLKIKQNGTKNFIPLSEKNAIINLGRMKKNDGIEISFNQPVFKTKEGAPGYDTSTRTCPAS